MLLTANGFRGAGARSPDIAPTGAIRPPQERTYHGGAAAVVYQCAIRIRKGAPWFP